MHQTFYIDIDEEITSIVDRLRKAKVEEVVIVVPKRALLIQSLVNLKLLKKEADNLGIQLMVVTQDKLGKLLVEKAGILVQNKLDESLEEEVLVFEDEKKDKEKNLRGEAIPKEKNLAYKNKMDEIGSNDYFSKAGNTPTNILVREEGVVSGKKDSFEKITNKELVTHVSREVRSKKPLLKRSSKPGSSLDMVRNIDIEEGISRNPSRIFSSRKKTILNEKETKLADFFAGQSGAQKNSVFSSSQESLPKKRNREKIQVSGKFWRIFTFFGLGAIIIFGVVGAYLFLPKAIVTIFAKGKSQTVDVEIKGDSKTTAVNFDLKSIPANLISAEAEVSETFSATGNKNIASKKARGTITIYNEFSSSSQPLVATTRFLSEGGKLFRLTSGVTVPGTTKNSDGTVQVGTIEAEIVADEAGSDYNIEPGKLTIPGFKDSGEEKYAKIYGKSEKSMSGGGSGGEEAKSITEQDINSAKAKMNSNIQAALKSKIDESLVEGMMIADDGINFQETQYRISNNSGEISNNFSITVTGKAGALSFREEDLKAILGKEFLKDGKIEQVDQDSMKIEFERSSLDMANGTIIMKIHATETSLVGIDPENLKKGILGKNENELKSFLSAYSDIEKVTVDYWPPFISGKIPLFERRVEVVLDKIPE